MGTPILEDEMLETSVIRIACRSRASEACYHGQDAGPIYVYPDDPIDEVDVEAVVEAYESDGTFNGETVICDACYIAPEERWPKVTDEPGPDDVVQVLMSRKMAARFEERCLGLGNTIGRTSLSPPLLFNEGALPTYIISVAMEAVSHDAQ